MGVLLVGASQSCPGMAPAHLLIISEREDSPAGDKGPRGADVLFFGTPAPCLGPGISPSATSAQEGPSPVPVVSCHTPNIPFPVATLKSVLSHSRVLPEQFQSPWSWDSWHCSCWCQPAALNGYLGSGWRPSEQVISFAAWGRSRCYLITYPSAFILLLQCISVIGEASLPARRGLV